MSQSQDTVQNENHSRSDSTAPPDCHQQEEPHQVPSASTAQAEMAQAFRDLARGEQQAAAIEANLASLESKLDALLASIEATDPAEVNGNTDENPQKDRASEEKQKKK
ncbi:hypothetical protein EV127DRAFT_483374 [Xylaria flabelliformis]|nr:hypothetical protein EV127DRAFT_483374 [Xylaria flabelliformis]